ncbi:hypothetical protein [Staphylococcus arlettae]|nr:hypothetical protein [Staphylococcus arlettae]MCD8839514.1 hypothetical protein [Staphylococcus arlettae]
MNPLVLTLATLFFGTSMKATYDILINIYFGFEEDIPKYYKKEKFKYIVLLILYLLVLF